MRQIPSSVLLTYAAAIATLADRRRMRKTFHWAFGTDGGTTHFVFYVRLYQASTGVLQDRAFSDLRELHRLRRANGVTAQELRAAARERCPAFFSAP